VVGPVTALVTFVLGAGIGLGVYLVGCGLLGRQVFGSVAPSRRPALTSRLIATSAVAATAGIAAYALTQWIVGGLLAALAAAAAPRLLAGGSDYQREIALVEAIAAWAEMLRDTMAAAAGLEQAIVATGPIAPPPIAGPVSELAVRLGFDSLPAALRRFADDVNHPTCDFVIAALVIAAEKEARDLGPLLGQLAGCARDEAKMRTRIWIDRAKTRTSVKVIAGCVVAFAAGLLVFSRSYLAPYDDVGGQLMLLVIGGLFVVALAGMDRMGRIAMPERFVSRRTL
jgi:tight adherence protein B